VPNYEIETITPSANGTVTDTTQFYAQASGPLLLQTQVTTSANGLVRTTGEAVNGDTSNDFWTTDTIVLNADGSQTETVATYNKAGLISETARTASANGLSTTTLIDANGALSGSNPVFNSETTDNTVINGDGGRTETLTASAANGATIEQAVTTVSADQQTVTTNRYLDQTGNIATVDQSEVVQTQANGSVIDTITSYNASHSLLSTVVSTVSGNGLATSTVIKNASGAALDSQSDTTVYDSNGDAGTTETFLDTDTAVGFTTSLTRKTSGNASSTTATLNLAGALAGAANGFGAVASDNVSIDGTGARNETIVDTINGASTSADTTTIRTSANQLSTSVSTALGSSNPYITQQTTIALDGSKSQVTTYYDPAALSVIEEQTTINTSFDGRTVTTTQMSANDQVGQSFASFTPTFNDAGYNVETNTFVKNADETTTDTRSGSGSFGATAYTQTVNIVTGADSSQVATTLNYDANGSLVGQIVAEISPDGLIKSYAYDTTGKESIANLNAATADIVSGAALPSLLGTDIIESDTTTLNSNGSSTKVVKTAFGNSFANQRSLTTTITSANGLVTTTFVDNDGSGIYQEVGTVTIQSDGSQTRVYNFYDNRSGTQQISSMPVGATLLGTNTYTVSANGLVTTLTTSTGITDTTAAFASANGSY
jgi:hypothetical protein